jgi:hypothetical protein
LLEEAIVGPAGSVGRRAARVIKSLVGRSILQQTTLPADCG